MVVSRIFPPPRAEVDIATLYGNEGRQLPPDRPYVTVNMVASIDGATAVDGVTKALGSTTDRAIFLHLREVADAILVGASTIRAERYGPARPTPAARASRVERGKAATPPIVVVSRSVTFDWQSALFTDNETRPILLVPGDVEPEKLKRASELADVVTCGEGTVDLLSALGQLRSRGIEMLLCEGGPTLNTELLNAGLVDELCLTIAPLLVGGPHPRGVVAASTTDTALPLVIEHVLEEDSFLYLRYVSDSGHRSGSSRPRG